MSHPPINTDLQARLRDAIVALHKMRTRLEAMQRRRMEPIAVVGIGCRFPGGADDPSAFWRLLRDGVDAMTPVPKDRWDIDAWYDPDPEAAGKMYVREGGFVSEPDRFDARFFGISPPEAAAMDPQQRLLLEVAYEALEHAGQVPSALANSATGVFVGVMGNDYSRIQMRSDDPTLIGPYTGTGYAWSFLAGRLSFFLGLQGPSMVVDTACSSSLVAIHLACSSLRNGECNLALAGGVNLILAPESNVVMCQLRALAPDGRCKTFDAKADGYGRGEGCGVVVLKRLSDALAAGDQVLAVIRGSAFNHDGPSGGLTVPNGAAQQKVIREALASGGVQPSQVSYVEAHGTGTPLGDPIELRAAWAVLGQGRAADAPLHVGSVKTNIGHLEGAAGVSGLIKAVLALHHKEIPPHLHLEKLNEYIAWDQMPLHIPLELTPWQVPPGASRICGVSSFGLSGINAHLVLEEAPEAAPRAPAPERSAELVVLAAKSEAALDAAAARLREHLDAHPALSLGDVAFSLATTRSPFEHRLAVAATSCEALREALKAMVEGQTLSGVVRGQAGGGSAPKVVFVFPGQGGQWLGMGRQLLAEEPVFRGSLEASDRAIRAETGWSLLDELAAEPDASQLGRIDVVQPALFAIEVALAALWRSWGVEPDAVVGHSMGEAAAAHVAGALSLEEAVAVICRRSRLLRRISGQGAMAMVELSLEEAEAALRGYEDRLSVAVSNGPQATVLSGEPAALAEVMTALEARGVFCRRVKVDVASHSPQVDPLRPELCAALDTLAPERASVPMRSTVTGAVLDGPELVAGYWADNLREPVRFAQVIEALLSEGHELFVEMSPHPVLTPAVEEMRRAAGRRGVAVASQRREHPERSALLEALGALWAHGAPVSWEQLFPEGGRRVPLPTYAFQRERYWLDVDLDAERARTSARRSSTSYAMAPREALDGSLYELRWQPEARKAKEKAPETEGRANGRPPWLLLADARGLGQKLAAQLEARGETAVLVLSGPTEEGKLVSEGPRQYRLDPAHPRGFRELLSEVFGDSPPRGVLHFWSLDAAPPDEAGLSWLEDAETLGPASALHLVQALAGKGWDAPPRIWWITRGAQPLGSHPPAVASAPLWGLGRTLMHEHPELHSSLIDLAPGSEGDPEEVAALLSEITAEDREDQVALYGGTRAVARLAPLSAKPGAVSVRPDGTYLITGGLGALGLIIARWLIDRGARHLVLVGRSGASASVRALLDGFEAEGVRVLAAPVDITSRQAIDGLLEEIRQTLPPLRGVVHGAGILDDGIALQLDRARLRRVMAPKVDGAWNLHCSTAAESLDFFVLLSSMSSVLGAPGQANYAAANAFLDALAHHRRALGLPALSINWGAWARTGLAEKVSEAQWSARGLELLAPEQGVRVLERWLGSAVAQMGVFSIDWAVFLGSMSGGVPPFLSEIVRQSEGMPRAPEGAAKAPLLRRLEEVPAEARASMLVDHVRAEIAALLGRGDARAVQPGVGFFEMGMDSLMALELRRRLQAALGRSVPATAIFNYSTVESLGRYLSEALAPPASPVGPPKVAPRGEDTELIAQITQLSEEIAELSEEDAVSELAALADDILQDEGESFE